MKKYIEIAKILFKAQIVYRFDVIMSVTVAVSKIIFAYVLWGAVFNGTTKVVSGFTFDTMLTYYILSSFFSQIEMSDGVSGEISGRIRGGSFSKFMVIPVSTQSYFIAQTIGAMLFYMIFNLIAAVAWLFLFGTQFAFTHSPVLICEALLLVFLGLMFMIQLNYFLGILAFRFLDIGIFLMIKNNIIAFITGTLVPLTMLPEGLVSVMRLFPFYYVTYLPTMLFLGRNVGEAPTGIAVLMVWTLLFTILNRYAYNKMRVIYDGVGI